MWYDIFVKAACVTRRDRAEGELLKTGHAKFSHDKNIERNAEPLRDFVGDRHAASGQAKHDDVVAAGVIDEFLGELSPSFGSIWKSSFHAAFPFLIGSSGCRNL